ncbi:MAG TPA: ribulose-phosphate 3-epimerase [Actinomycetota bacterium]|nr:ribulose-phosphate 3-epimerase [Actinomycetota bacterium]
MARAKLAASILSADFAHLGDQVKLVEPYADMVHVDVMDAHFVPPLTIGPVVVESLRPMSALPLHCHLMIERPEALFDDFAKAGTDMVTFHLEAAPDPEAVIAEARARGMRAGMAVNPDTPVENVFAYLDRIDNLIVMSVRPGWAGQDFMEEVLPKVEAAREEIDRRGVTVDVEVDGGINEESGRRCLEAGATVLAVASSIFKASDPADAARRLSVLTRESGGER